MGAADAFDCDTCPHKNCDSSNPATFPRWEIKGLIKSNTCLLPMVTDDSWAILSWYRHYQRGVLLKAGGLLEQPNFYLEVMNIVERYSGPNRDHHQGKGQD